MADTSKIRVLKTRHQGDHQEVVEQLEECLAIAKNDTSIGSVIVSMEDRNKTVVTYWTGCGDRAQFGSRLILAGLKRLGVKTGG